MFCQDTVKKCKLAACIFLRLVACKKHAPSGKAAKNKSIGYHTPVKSSKTKSDFFTTQL